MNIIVAKSAATASGIRSEKTAVVIAALQSAIMREHPHAIIDPVEIWASAFSNETCTIRFTETEAIPT